MKYIFIFVLLVFAACGCGDYQEVRKIWVCSCEEQAKMADWIKENVGPSNNYSDEEMEDVVSQLERTAVRVHCKQKNKNVHFYQDFNGIVILRIELDSCEVAPFD